MTALASDEHVWFRQRLADHLLDLLDDAEAARLHAHTTTCANCSGLLAAATRERPDGWLGADHPSPAALARWRREPRGLDAIEARAIEEHVESCAACRFDLAELSGEPVELATHPARTGGTVARVRSRRLGDWAWGAAAGALATAAALLVFWQRPASPPTPPPPKVSPDPAERVLAPEATPLPGFLPAARPIHVRSPIRGGDSTTRIALTEPRAIVPLVIPTLFVPDATVLEIELLSGSRSVVSHTSALAGDAQRSGVLLDTSRLEAGPGVLRVRWKRGDGTEERRYPVDFQRE